MKAVLMSDYADYVSTRVQSSPGMGRSRSGSANFGFRIALAAVLLYLSFAASLGELAGPSLNLGAIMALDTIGGKIARAAIELAVEDVNRNTSVLNGTLLNLHIRDSNQDALKGASGALELLRKGCVSIVGPQSSVVAEFVANLGSTAHVPVVTFAATNPSLSMHRFPFFIRMSHSDSMQMIAIAKLLQNYKWRDVVLVYEDDDFWNGAIPAFNDALRAIHANIVHRAAISPQADISVMRKVLQDELMKLESRVFIVHMSPESAITLSSQAYKLGMIRSPEYVWIITDGFASLLDSNPSSLMSMEGVLGVKRKIPQFNQPRVQEFTARWKQRFRAQNPTTQALELNAYALIAYDTVWAIANAIAQKPKLFTGNFLVASNSTKFLNLGVLEGGEQLKKQILDTNFLGLSGHVRLNAEKGEPLDSSYDIVNVIEGGCRVVGSWTKGEGLVLKQGVKWGGESGKVPRGWVKPVPGEKLKIGVPWERGFTELITIKPVHTATQNQTYDITGFCIDVFKAAVKRLEYELPHEFIPYGNGNVTEDYYDDLVYQVYLKKFDAVVGGVAVTANRSKYVDFTQPYADAGLSMTVVMEDDGSSEPWAFLLPFTPAVWITTLAFFFFTGAVVWLLEHRRNSQFTRGSRRKQVLTFLWFSFSTAFKTHTEIVESALGKAVVIIWFFCGFGISV